MPRVAAWIALSLGLSLCGCQSLRSWEHGCGDVYSGVRFYRDQLPELPLDGRIFFTFDLLPTAVVDTIALPVTAFGDPERPRGGFPIGCRWAN